MAALGLGRLDHADIMPDGDRCAAAGEAPSRAEETTGSLSRSLTFRYSPVNSGSRRSTNAAIASPRSFECRNAAFQSDT